MLVLSAKHNEVIDIHLDDGTYVGSIVPVRLSDSAVRIGLHLPSEFRILRRKVNPYAHTAEANFAGIPQSITAQTAVETA